MFSQGRVELISGGEVTGIDAAMARVSEIQSMMGSTSATPTPPVAATSGFAQQLAQAQTPGTSQAYVDPTTLPTSGYSTASLPISALQAATQTSAVTQPNATGQNIADIATRELGVREEPSGSNTGARIAEYRTATAGSGVGPWCAYFTSWVTAQAGVPIGANGQGEGYVPNVQKWAAESGKWIPAGQAPAQVGDLVVFDRGNDGVLDHIGVVTQVNADGGITTVEGNSSNAVSQRTYAAGDAAVNGFVRTT
jgi:cell wall-associated NlpC family hydrolase